jgi:hypothetical protein
VIIATNYILKNNSQAKLERAERRNSRSSTHSPASTSSRKDSDASAAGPTETKKVGTTVNTHNHRLNMEVDLQSLFGLHVT